MGSSKWKGYKSGSALNLQPIFGDFLTTHEPPSRDPGMSGLRFKAALPGCSGELLHRNLSNLPIVSIVVPFLGFNQFYIQDPKR